MSGARSQASPLLRAGLPLLSLVVLGSVGLSQLLKVRCLGLG